MKKKKIILVSLLLSISFMSHAQHWTLYDQKKEYKLNELEIINEHFLHSLDSLVFKSKCYIQDESKYKEYKYSNAVFIKDKNTYSFLMEQLKVPRGDSSDYGFFVLNDHVFIISGDYIPDKLFKKKRKKRKFSYRYGGIPVLEELPTWGIIYDNGTFILGYSPCFNFIDLEFE